MERGTSKIGLLTVQFILIHVLLPIFVGGLIYTLWRKSTLLIFSWYDFIGLIDMINYLRSVARPLYTSLPDWFLFCLPDGLWVYATTAFMACLWIDSPKSHFLFWISIAPTLAIGGEVCQFFGFVQGTYETKDIAFYIAGFAAAMLLVSQISRKVKDEKRSLG